MAITLRLLVLSTLAEFCFSCDPQIYSFSLSFGDSLLSSDQGCYSSFDHAVEGAGSGVTAMIEFLKVQDTAPLTAPITVFNMIAIEGHGNTLLVQALIKVEKRGWLSMRNLTIQAGANGPVVESYGSVFLENIVIPLIHIQLLAIYEGEAGVLSSRISSATLPLIFIRALGINMNITSSQFDTFAGDVMQIDSTEGENESYVRLWDCEMRNMAGAVLQFVGEGGSRVQIDVRRSLVSDLGGTFFSGNSKNIDLKVDSSIFSNMNQIVSGTIFDSDLRFENCTFQRLLSIPFELESLNGTILISNSEIKEVRKGPVFLLSRNLYSPKSAVISLFSCKVINVTNSDYHFSAGIAFATSATVLISHADISLLKLSQSGLLSLTAGVTSLSHIYYHDSSAVYQCFMEAVSSSIVIRNVTMFRVENNGGAFVLMTSSFGSWDRVTIVDSIDTLNTRAPVFIILAVWFGGKCDVTDCYFRNPGDNAVSMTAINGGVISISSTAFVNSSSHKTMFSAVNLGFLSLKNVTFVNLITNRLFACTSLDYCASMTDLKFQGKTQIAYMFTLQSGSLQLSDSTFEGIGMNVLQMLGGVAVIANTTFRSSSIVLCWNCVNSQLTLANVTLDHVSAQSLFQLLMMDVNVTGMSVEGGSVGQIFELEASSVSVAHFNLKNCLVDSFGGLAQILSGSTIAISSSIIDGVTGRASFNKGLIYVQESSIIISTSYFHNFDSTLIYSVTSKVKIELSQFKNGGAKHSSPLLRGGVLRDDSAIELSITDSLFTNISADFGGVLYLTRNNDEKIRYNFASNKVSHCSAANSGGGIYATFGLLNVSMSTFESNIARQGGAIWVSRTELKAQHSSFLNNSASLEGGAIQYVNSSLKLINASFSENTAIYGPNIASKAVTLSYLDNSNRPFSNYLVEAASGQPLKWPIFIGLYDTDGQLIVTDNASRLTLFVHDQNQSIDGSVLLYPVRGKFTAQNLIVVGEPLTNVSVYGETKEFSDFVFTVHLRNCTLGEYFEHSKCRLCSNNMYSLHPDTPCTLCPNSATCSEGYKLSLKPGFWRVGTMSDEILPCNVRELCLGGFESECAEGQMGIMCLQCAENYFKANQLQCIHCGSDGVPVLKTLIAALVSVCVATITFCLGGYAWKVILLVFDYCHMLNILSNLSVYWPYSLMYFFTILGNITSLGLTAFSDLCLSLLLSYKSLYRQMILATAYFFSVILGVGSISILMAKVVCNISYVKLGRLLAFLGYLMLPLLYLSAMKFFSCFEIEGVSRLTFDPSIECGTSQHKFFTMLLALPILILSVFAALGLTLVSFSVYIQRLNVALEVQNWAVLLLRKLSMSSLLLLTNTFLLESQVSFALLISISTEVVLKKFSGDSGWFGKDFFNACSSSSSLLAVTCVLYSAESEKSQLSFLSISYLEIVTPLIFQFSLQLFYRRSSRKDEMRILPEANEGSVQSIGHLINAPNPSFISEDSDLREQPRQNKIVPVLN